MNILLTFCKEMTYSLDLKFTLTYIIKSENIGNGIYRRRPATPNRLRYPASCPAPFLFAAYAAMYSYKHGHMHSLSASFSADAARYELSDTDGVHLFVSAIYRQSYVTP